MKRNWIVGTAILAGAVGLVLVLHWTRVLPFPPAPPYYIAGDHITLTPTNPWTWFK